MPTKELAAAMYQAKYSGESGAGSVNLGKALVSKGDTIVADSFLKDRPVPFVDVPVEIAEIRVGAKSNFQYDLSIGSKDRQDVILSRPQFGGVTWPDPPPSDNDDDPTKESDQIIKIDIRETDRIIKVIRVEGSDGESWVDVERIDQITFQMPTRRGPTGTITEYWTFILNNGSPIVNGVDVSKIPLNDGDTIIDVENP